MDNALEKYKAGIKKVLSAYQELKTDSTDVELLFDDERLRYMAVRVGWHKQKRIHLCLIHIDVREGSVIIQANNTEDEIDAELVEADIPREKICFGWLPPEAQALTRLSQIKISAPNDFAANFDLSASVEKHA